jgi:ribosomal protein S21
MKKISEYGGKEKYASKAAMKKHEKSESKSTERKEKKAHANKGTKKR